MKHDLLSNRGLDRVYLQTLTTGAAIKANSEVCFHCTTVLVSASHAEVLEAAVESDAVSETVAEVQSEIPVVFVRREDEVDADIVWRMPKNAQIYKEIRKALSKLEDIKS